MQSYTKVYLEFFNLTTADWIPYTVCGQQAVDIHHIFPRSKWKKLLNDINNLCALCRTCHDKYFAVKYRGFLYDLQQKKIKSQK